MYILNKIRNFPKKTLESSLKEVMKSKNRIISGKYSPIVFGMKYEEIEYKSIDGLNLYGWLIKRSENADTIILIHGRNNNRIFCVKFLQLILYVDSDKKYNIFIPDLRNSGKSDTAKTGFGYFFAKDIYSTMKMLKDKFNLNNFILYGFSQGGLGSAASLYFFKKEIIENNIIVNKLILDSPISNAKEIILYNAKIFGFNIPKFFLIPAFIEFNNFIDGNLSKLKLSSLLGEVPTLILQSKKDIVTPYDIIKKEYNNLIEREDYDTISPVRFKVFRKGQHVRIYLEYKQEYTETIRKFLESEKI